MTRPYPPDVLDAIVMAWAIRKKGIVKQLRKSGAMPARAAAVEADPFAIDGF